MLSLKSTTPLLCLSMKPAMPSIARRIVARKASPSAFKSSFSTDGKMMVLSSTRACSSSLATPLHATHACAVSPSFSPFGLPCLRRKHTDSAPKAHPDYARLTEEMLAAQPAAALLKMRITNISPGHIEITMEAANQWKQHNGFIFGGIIAALSDNVGGLAIKTLAGEANILAANMSLHFLAPADGDCLIGIGKTVRVGKKLGVSSFEIFSEKDVQAAPSPSASSSASYSSSSSSSKAEGVGAGAGGGAGCVVLKRERKLCAMGTHTCAVIHTRKDSSHAHGHSTSAAGSHGPAY